MGRALDGAWADILHNHGLWMYPSTVATRYVRKTKCPLMISVHGMLDPWAVRNSSWRKWIARALYEYEHMTSAACIGWMSQDWALPSAAMTAAEGGNEITGRPASSRVSSTNWLRARASR